MNLADGDEDQTTTLTHGLGDVCVPFLKRLHAFTNLAHALRCRAQVDEATVDQSRRQIRQRSRGSEHLGAEMRVGWQVFQHCGDAHRVLAIDLDRLAHRVVGAEIFAGHPAREHESVGTLQRGVQIPGDRRKLQDLEDPRIGPEERGLPRLDVSAPQAVGSVAVAPQHLADLLDLRKLELQVLDDRTLRIAARARSPARDGDFVREPVDVLVMRQEPVVGGLMTHEERDEQRGRESRAEPQDVDHRMQAAAREVAHGRREVVSQHAR